MMIQLTARGDQEGSAPSTHALEGRHTALTDVFERLIQLGEGLHALITDLVDPDRHLRLVVNLILEHSLNDLPARRRARSGARDVPREVLPKARLLPV